MILKSMIIGLVYTLIILFVLGCGNTNKADSYGAVISEQQAIKVESIFEKPEDFKGKTVKVEGKIVNECPGGHWFYLKGEKETIYVTLSGFILPQRVGKIAVVEGSVINDDGKTAILGKGVEIK